VVSEISFAQLPVIYGPVNCKLKKFKTCGKQVKFCPSSLQLSQIILKRSIIYLKSNRNTGLYIHFQLQKAVIATNIQVTGCYLLGLKLNFILNNRHSCSSS
jgi:hypothetical protein